MKNINKNNYEFNFQKKALVSVMTAVFTTVMTTGVSQASDIDIYQQAKSGDITLMFLLDLSGSMDRSAGGGQNACDLPSGVTAGTIKSATETYLVGVPSYVRQWCQSGTSSSAKRYYDRLTRLKDGMIDLLYGNAANGVTKLDDDKVIGLSSFQYSNGTNQIPARPLGATVLVGGKSITQRQLLINTITSSSFTANGRTPTANAYADVAAYLLGTTTSGISQSGFSSSSAETKIDTKTTKQYIQPSSLSQTDDAKKCSGQGIYVLTDGEPNESSTTIAGNLMRSAIQNNSFNCNNSLLAEVNNPTYGFAGAWSCIGNFSQSLLRESSNPANLKIKTAVVGFGSSFNGIDSYNKNLTQAQNIANINNASVSGNLAPDIKNAARWGVYGEGGWYSGSSSTDIVNSVNSFISNLATEIPAVTTGSPTIPNDALYPAQLQNFAYYPQFDPTPDKAYQLWAGNLKKYNVSSTGNLVDKFSHTIMETSGKIKDNYDLWSPVVDNNIPESADSNTLGSKKRALMGGVKSQLVLNMAQNTTTQNRKLLTNRVGSSGSTTFTGGTELRQVKTSDITDAIYKNDPNRGYLLTLLGFKGLEVDSPNTITATQLTNAAELRQVGAVMHSSPLLLTNQGKIVSNQNNISTSERKDYVLFGTTQGLLHVVDAITGKEKFAFVPNEMVENQQKAFLSFDTTSGGINNMYYGIDGPWTAYTEYVVGNNRVLTVGKGANKQEGMQLVYGGLRMGGKSYYSLDLQDIDSPSLKFHIDPQNQKVYYNNSSKSFTQLQHMGQSWSKPKIAWVRWNGERKMVMFVGGGYDIGYEDDEYDQTNAVGAGIYMFDALNGDLLWWTGKNATNTTSGVIGVNHADMKYSVVSEIRDVDSDSDGLADNVYFGDLGGQVWRIDFDNGIKTPTSKFARTPVRLLNLNKGSESPRFYDMPAFSIYSTNGTKFAVISVGSGNRSKPLAEYTVNATTYDYDATYNIYDKDVARSDLLTTSSYYTKDIGLTGTFALKEIDNTTRFIQNTPIAAYATTGGWFYKFKSNKVQSAKVFGTPLVMNRKMYVSYFDASKPGLSGDCGAGVKGESFLSTFCMPYGQCVRTSNGNSDDDGDDDTLTLDDIPLGAGIQIPTTGNGCPPGEDCDKIEEEDGPDCLSSGSRVLITPQGGAGGAKTEVCLTPLKWYEKLK